MRKVELAKVSTWYPPSMFIFKPIFKLLMRLSGSVRASIVGVMLSSLIMHVGVVGYVERSKPILESYGTLWCLFTFGVLTLYAAFGDLKAQHKKS